MLALAIALVRSVGRLATMPALFWFSITYVQLLQPALGADWDLELPALNTSAYMAAIYFMIRLLARQIGHDDLTTL